MTAQASGRPGSVLHLYRELWRFTAGQRWMLLGSVTLLISAQLTLLSIPYISGRAINALQLGGFNGLRDAGSWLVLVPLVAAASWLLHGPGRILERNVALSVRRRMSSLLVDRLMSLPLAWHESHHSGATAHRVQQSTHALSGFAQSQFIYLNSAVRLVGPLIALWYLEPKVGAAAAAGFAIICVSIVGFDRAMIRLAHKENDAERRYAAALVDTLGNTTTLFALRQGRGMVALLEKRLQAIFEPLKRSIVLNEAKWCTVDLASKVLSCGLVILFAWCLARPGLNGATAQKTLMLGSIYMVWEYALQAGGVISSVAAHFQTFARQHADYTSADVIREASPGHLSADPPAMASAQWNRLDIRELTFRHEAGRDSAPTLDRLSFSLKRGKRYALVGGSGSGKSTLLRVLSGLYPCERVLIECDDGPASFLPVETARFLRSVATLIPQDAEVIEGTLAENLALCESVRGAPHPAQFVRALELSRATDFIACTAEGLETRVAERAANWSGGQRSRIALARGILAAEGSTLVLLDEPTAALDPVTESHVYTNLFAAFENACIVSSIHRLNLLDRFDEVLVMDRGRLIAQGPVAALTLHCPEFQQLLVAQHREATASVSSEAIAAA